MIDIINVYRTILTPDFQSLRINNNLEGIETIQYLGPVIWNNISIEKKVLKILTYLKQKLENSGQTVHVEL